MAWIRSPMARSSAGILARLSRRSRSPPARSSAGLRPDAALRSRAVAATAARSASLKTLSSFRVAERLLVVCFVGMSWPPCGGGVGSGGRLLGDLPLLQDPDRVAERIAK